MTIKNKYKEILEVGQEFKNYKYLCNHLKEEQRTGDARNAQIKNWERYFSYSKKGHRMTVTEIYCKPLDKIDNRKGGNNKVKYIHLIEKLILDLLVQSKTENIFLSKNRFFQELKIANSNYTYGKRFPNRASKELNVERAMLDDFYEITDSMLNRNLNTALESLKDKALISCNMVITVGTVEATIEENKNFQMKGYKREFLDSFGDTETKFEFSNTGQKREHRKATEKEIDAIRDTERYALIQLGLNSKKEIFPTGKNDDFYKIVTDKLFREYGIYVYYNSYNISFNSDYVFDEWKKQEMFLESDLRIDTQTELNSDIIERMNLNAIHRHRKAPEMYDKTKKNKYKLRMAFSYLNNNDKLIENFISIEKDNPYDRE